MSNKTRIIVGYIIGMLTNIFLAALLGQISLVLDFIAAVIGGLFVTLWAINAWIEL